MWIKVIRIPKDIEKGFPVLTIKERNEVGCKNVSTLLNGWLKIVPEGEEKMASFLPDMEGVTMVSQRDLCWHLYCSAHS